MLEWRVDDFAEYTDDAALREVLETLRTITKETILLATVRTVKQGGGADLSELELFELYDRIAQAHTADIIDVEAFHFARPTEVIRRLHERGALVLLSHHDFDATPMDAQMERYLTQMADMDGDIVKLAVMPHTFSDTLRLMQTATAFHADRKNIPLIAIAMGKEGALSRVAGELFGSCVTFASGNEASAPGQMPFAEAQAAVDFINRFNIYG